VWNVRLGKMVVDTQYSKKDKKEEKEKIEKKRKIV
jgi:hypothetical protein